MNTGVPQEVSGADLGKLLGLSERSIRNLAQEGKIIRAGHGMYRLAESVQSLLADARKSSVSNSLQREQEALVAAKRRSVELRNAENDHRLVELEETYAVLDELVGLVKSQFGGLPARFTRNIEDRRKLEGIIYDIFCCLEAKYAERAAELREFGEIDGAKKRARRRKLR